MMSPKRTAPCLQATRTWKRSLTKTLTWRLVATIDTFAISALVTGNVKWAGSIVTLEVITKLAWYFLHERAWAYTRLGLRLPKATSRDPRSE